MMEEIWKDVQGFEGRYQVSNMGRVRYPDKWVTRQYQNGNVATFINRKAGIKQPCLSKTGHYYIVLLRGETFKETINVDDLVARHFCDGYEYGMIITHKDGNILNNAVGNLGFSWPKNMPGEIWKPVMGYEGLYKVSNMGRVMALDKTKKRNYKYAKDVDVPVDGRLLHPNFLKRGYALVTLHKGGIRKQITLHRLVALHFCNGYTKGFVVNHKDENPRNCQASNLEWCTQEYNHHYGTGIKRSAEKQQKRVAQYAADGTLIAIYSSGKEASEKTGFPRPCISDWCRGAHPCKAGYIWRFVK